jgi:hypothetical protein
LPPQNFSPCRVATPAASHQTEAGNNIYEL